MIISIISSTIITVITSGINAATIIPILTTFFTAVINVGFAVWVPRLVVGKGFGFRMVTNLDIVSIEP